MKNKCNECKLRSLCNLTTKLVHILPITESGTIVGCRQDDDGRTIIEVKLLSNDAIHLCREKEITW